MGGVLLFVVVAFLSPGIRAVLGEVQHINSSPYIFHPQASDLTSDRPNTNPAPYVFHNGLSPDLRCAPSLEDWECCTAYDKCLRAGEGDCDDDNDCGPGLRCGQNNCGSQFGRGKMDCCEVDRPQYHHSPVLVTPDPRRTVHPRDDQSVRPTHPLPYPPSHTRDDRYPSQSISASHLASSNTSQGPQPGVIYLDQPDYYDQYDEYLPPPHEDPFASPATHPPPYTLAPQSQAQAPHTYSPVYTPHNTDRPVPTPPGSVTGVCRARQEDWNCCNPGHQCGESEGDCDDDVDCKDDLVCGKNNCIRMGNFEASRVSDCCERRGGGGQVVINNPVDGAWSVWSGWSACSRDSSTRTRLCNSPTPQRGGRRCVGDHTQVQSCTTYHHTYPGGDTRSVDGMWSQWASWSPCDKTCDGGRSIRTRLCENPAPANGGDECEGSNVQVVGCNLQRCVYGHIYSTTPPPPVDGAWSTWTPWTDCDRPCGGGTNSRTRKCESPAPSHGGSDCDGDHTQVQACNSHQCQVPVHGGWSRWGWWTPCSKTCGDGGSTSRTRRCDNPAPAFGGNNCVGLQTQVKWCNRKPCEIHGSWSHWGHWTPCDKTCGTGSTSRSRRCNSPTPMYGGRDCDGDDRQTMECNKQACPVPVDGGWSPFTGCGPCSVTCGQGTCETVRFCNSPTPMNGGNDCVGDPIKLEVCTKPECKIDGGWGYWGSWSECDRTCGSGRKTRERPCDHPVPAHGGKQCVGHSMQAQWCHGPSCLDPVDGAWSDWKAFTTCSKTCGGGVQSEHRECNNPRPSLGGANCVGATSRTNSCNEHPCPVYPVDGGWGLWGPWSQCDKTCGRGTSARSRPCDHPVPANGGRECQGHHKQIKACKTKLCPVDGGWSPWTSYGPCSKSCGSGVQSGTRECDNPKPSLGGATCVGPTVRTQQCNTDPCAEPEPEPEGEPMPHPEPHPAPHPGPHPGPPVTSSPDHDQCPQVLCCGTDGVTYPTPCHVPDGVICRHIGDACPTPQTGDPNSG